MSLDVLSYHYQAELLKNEFTFLMTLMILDFHDSSTFIHLKSTFQYKKKKKNVSEQQFYPRYRVETFVSLDQIVDVQVHGTPPKLSSL